MGQKNSSLTKWSNLSISLKRQKTKNLHIDQVTCFQPLFNLRVESLIILFKRDITFGFCLLVLLFDNNFNIIIAVLFNLKT